jgi:hypothetical protein
MKLPMPTSKEVYDMADRAASVITNTNSRSVNTLIIENAIRNALALVVDRMDIQIPQPIGLDLSKPR